ncbi:MAG: DUF6249 domain-containing protein [Woeseiaceae bacterium]|nr:DUF6249 domain-containing protein [Woeseiaceae bacterium]
MEGIFGIIGVFGGLTVVLSLFFWFRYRNRRDMQETIRTALDKGHELTPDIIDRLGQPKPAKDKDLRLGVIWLALAAALGIAGVFVPDPSGYASGGIWTGAAFPLCLGLGYMLLWMMRDKDE